MNGQSNAGWKWLLALLILGGGAWAAWHYYPRAEATVEYQTTTVAYKDIVQLVTATGTLNAVVSVQVGSQISGIIKKLNADFNTPVKAGQVVAQLDPATFEAVVHQAEGEVAAAEAALELAQLNERRKRQLAKEQAGTQADLDKAVADLHSSEASVKLKKAVLEKASIDLGRCTITAPVDGVVISRNVDVGQTVAATMTAPVLFTIANDLTKMQIEANVSEADIGGIKQGQETSFIVDAYPSRVFKGVVKMVRYAPVTVDNIVSYVTVIEVDNGKLELLPGMTANVSIVLAEVKAAMAVSNAALSWKPPVDTGSKPAGEGGPRRTGGPRPAAMNSARPTVYRLEGGTPVSVEVGTGITDNIHTEIKTGLQEGMVLVTGIVARQPAVVAAPGASPFGGGGGGGGGGPRRGM